MKHTDSERRLVELCHEADIRVSSTQATMLLDHLRFILERNRSVNLTAIADEAQGIRLHVVDSLLALPEVLRAPEGPMLDIGTGAGYPGLPLAVLTGRQTLLLDSVGKKVAAVAEFIVEYGLADQVRAEKGRAEEIARPPGQRFAAVLARAVSELPALVELAAPLLCPEGVFVAMKAQLSSEELARGGRVAAKVGLRQESLRQVMLPGGDECRTIVSYRRAGDSHVALPRRDGMAQRKPLA